MLVKIYRSDVNKLGWVMTLIGIWEILELES